MSGQHDRQAQLDNNSGGQDTDGEMTNRYFKCDQSLDEDICHCKDPTGSFKSQLQSRIELDNKTPGGAKEGGSKFKRKKSKSKSFPKKKRSKKKRSKRNKSKKKKRSKNNRDKKYVLVV